MPFFCFDQNNGFGKFDTDSAKGISCFVVIEAINSYDANCRAEDLGLYFYGCKSGIDCPCCGDRWHPQRDEDGTKTPEVYSREVQPGQLLDKRGPRFVNGPQGYIHYLSGETKSFW
jgi:hypothetical protein